MMWTATRPPEKWSSVAKVLAASVGATKPGRWATSSPSRSVFAATWAATWVPSGLPEPYPIRTRSNPASSWARANRTV